MSKRITINMIPTAEETLSSLMNENGSWYYRRNTIINAAIVAFKELSKEKQIDYLRQVRSQDGRLWHPIR